MELKLKGHGTIKITSATLVEGGDILIEAEDKFIYTNSDFNIQQITLVEINHIWSAVIWFSVPDDVWGEDTYLVADIENSNDIYRLKTLL